ncbi:hypothetical protein PVL29_009175 [Vitis rotundifolia]|uniref:Uncharacterized protein n=1 Tax=Vitis rotundifolia TaxID=103349 RepID=A0AA38ZXS0_VITRO|nr:hypothetical protein PVL29_009175 [Vitis rotundifolia]
MFTQGSGDIIASTVQPKSAVDQISKNSSLSSSPKSVLPKKVLVDQVSSWGFNPEENNGETTDELLEPLLLCCESLQSCRSGILADGRLDDLIRRVAIFGMGMHSSEDCLKPWKILTKVNYAMSGYELEMLVSRGQEKFIGKYLTGKFPSFLRIPYSLKFLIVLQFSLACLELILNMLISLFICARYVWIFIYNFIGFV